MERIVKINDDLQERIDGVVEELESLIEDFLKENPDWDGEATDLYDEINNNGVVSEFVDSATPICYYNIDGLWFLYKNDFIDAYENAGIGNDPLENSGMTAIYLYIEEQVNSWFFDLDIDDYKEESE